MSPRRHDIVPVQNHRDDLADDSEGQCDLDDALDASRPGQLPTAKMQLEVALYIESMSAELRTMARSADLEGLAYFLEMVRIEASIQVERGAASP